MIYLVDVMMTLRMAPVFGVLEGLALAPMLALAGPLPRGSRLVFMALGGGFVIAFAAALFLPAYSAERPLHLNLLANYDMDAKEAKLYASTDPGDLPPAVREQLKVGETTLPGVTAKLASRPLDFVDRPSASATVLGKEPAPGGGWLLNLQLSAPGAQLVRLRIPAGAFPTEFKYNASTVAMREPQ